MQTTNQVRKIANNTQSRIQGKSAGGKPASAELPNRPKAMGAPYLVGTAERLPTIEQRLEFVRMMEEDLAEVRAGIAAMKAGGRGTVPEQRSERGKVNNPDFIAAWMAADKVSSAKDKAWAVLEIYPEKLWDALGEEDAYGKQLANGLGFLAASAQADLKSSSELLHAMLKKLHATLALEEAAKGGVK